MIPPDELRALCDRIIKSGELGRSRIYAAILQYLVEHAIAGTTPKEISIAMEVLGREADFDVGKDSIVRVHIYHLRNKLNTYFARQGSTEQYRIEIPKGQYLLSITENRPAEAEPAPEPAEVPATSITGKPLQRKNFTPYLAAVAILLLVVNLWAPREAEQAVVNPFSASPLWSAFLDDSAPVLVLVGDYYIMGEDDSSGTVSRMVREFDINSSAELSASQASGENARYRNLDMSYAPTSAPKVLTQLMKVLGPDADRVHVKMMSELNTNDLVGQHVIYLGLLSGMRSLTDLMFADSGLAIGSTYDELIDVDTNALYASSSGLSVGVSSYRDYGMLSTFPAPGGTQYLLLAGMRDEGLVNLAEEVMSLENLAQLQPSLSVLGDSAGAFEALFEVLGFDNTNFDAKLVYQKALDTKVVWETRLMGQP